MGRPVDTAAVAARRLALLRSLDHGVVLIPAAHERQLERDYIQDNDFRQNNTFFYFTELETQDAWRSEEHTSELQSQSNVVCRLLLEKIKLLEDASGHIRCGVYLIHP